MDSMNIEDLVTKWLVKVEEEVSGWSRWKVSLIQRMKSKGQVC
jgi:hypothetical protein